MVDTITNERDQQAAYRALGEAPDSRKIDISAAATAYSSTQLTPGVYRVWMPGGSPSDVLTAKRAATSSSPTLAAIATTASAYDTWPAHEWECVRVTDDEPYLWVRTDTGTGVVRLSRLGP